MSPLFLQSGLLSKSSFMEQSNDKIIIIIIIIIITINYIWVVTRWQWSVI